MATVDLKEFVEERLQAFDPDIDLTEGSPAQTQVVDPIVERFTPDPFEMNVDQFIDARLQQEFPDTNFREGSGIRDLLVKANQLLLDPISREVKLIKQGQSLANPDLLSSSEADALVANIFVSRDTGGLSTGTVRLYFNAPVSLNISVGNICYTADGLRFLPTTLQSITAEAMLFNQSGSLYYFDIQVTAEKAGSEYNVDKKAVIGITNLNTAVKVENIDRFEGGVEEETTDALVDKANTSITERSLVVARGAAARLDDQFSSLSHLQVVGMFDPEMQRDIIVGGELGPVLLSGTDGYTEDDDNGDTTTYSLKSRYTDFVAELFGASGDQIDEYWVTVSQCLFGGTGSVPVSNLDHVILPGAEFTTADIGSMVIILRAGDPANVGMSEILGVTNAQEVQIDRVGVVDSNMYWIVLRPPVDYEIDSVLGTNELKLKTQLPVDRQALIWSIRKKELTISDIPGGIVFSEDANAIVIKSNEVHIGGATDFYVRGTSLSEEELVLESVTDGEPVVTALTGQTDNSTSVKEEFFFDTNVNFVALGTKPGMSLIIENGADAGTKTILRVGVHPSGGNNANYLQVTPSLTATATDLRYRVVDEIDIDLREPKTLRGEGTDLQTIQLSQQVTTLSAIDFLSLGTEVGDTLRILNGDDADDYEVTGVSGVGNKNMSVAAQMTSTASNLRWELFKKHDGINFPLVRIKSLDLLDSSQQLTGNTVPYADPVDARGASFSNAGRGTKVSTTDAITGIVGTVDLDSLSYPLDNTALGKPIIAVSVNGAADVDIDLGGSASKAEVLNKINYAIYNIGGELSVDGESRLTLRSGDRWLVVQPESTSNSQNLSTVGLSALGEDNRQIKSLSNITDWSSSAYDLKTEKDTVFVKTGDNIGYLYLVAVSSTKIYAISFDEASGRVRFLQPNTSVTLAVGNKSYGTARVYFLDPTSFEVHGSWRPGLKASSTFPENVATTLTGQSIAEDEPARTYFTATIAGTTMRFYPDPDLKRMVIPVVDEDTTNNLTTDGTTSVESDASPSGVLGQNSRDAALDFLLREVHPGDLVDITYQPIQGDTDIRPVASGGALTYPTDLQGKTLIMSLDGSPWRTLTFSDQLTDESDVVDEINTFFGETIAYLETIASAKYLRLEADFEFTLRKDSTAIYGPGPLLWSTALVANQYNKAFANIDGYYRVEQVGFNISDPTKRAFLILDQPAVAGQSQHFEIFRPGNQRIHSTLMNANLENGLYYMDVELVSEGVGDEWNLDAGELFEVTNHMSDGYRLTVADDNLTFSMEEEVTLSLTRRFLTVGSSDRPDQATTLSKQNLQVTYERSPLVASIQAFASSQVERVLNASILVRHLQPHFLNFVLNYRGGSSADIVEEDVLSHLSELGPDESVECSDLVDIAYSRSATYVQTPIELVAVVHDVERKVSVERSEDYVTKGRLSTFFPDNITVSRETSNTL